MKNNQRDLSKEQFMSIPNDWIFVDKEDKSNLIHKYSNKGLTLYCLIKQSRTYKGIQKITEHDLLEWFNASRKRDKMKYFNIVNGLIKDKYIYTLDEYDFTKLVKENIYLTFPEYDNGYFILYYYELDEILNNNQNIINKDSLLSIFACIKRTYDPFDKKYCYPGIEQISNYTKLGHKTIIKGINLLRDMELILYDNPGTRVFKDGRIRESNNVYTMNYKGNDKILSEYIKQKKYETDIEYKKQQNRKISNLKRSIKMKMNSLDNKLDSGKITVQYYDEHKDKLTQQYNILVNEQIDEI